METSQERKETPLFRGLFQYAPAALKAIARLSFKGNVKHNGPDAPLRHARDKSGDHGDCILRHQMEFDKIDPETGEFHAVAVAWRAVMQLQELLERHGAPVAPAAAFGDLPNPRVVQPSAAKRMRGDGLLKRTL